MKIDSPGGVPDNAKSKMYLATAHRKEVLKSYEASLDPVIRRARQ